MFAQCALRAARVKPIGHRCHARFPALLRGRLRGPGGSPGRFLLRRATGGGQQPVQDHVVIDFFVTGYLRLKAKPLAYVMIPIIASAVGFVTNWVGVKMLFYPIEPAGPVLFRQKESPWGFFFWQGVVPTKAEKMASRLVVMVTQKLLSLPEAFGRLDPAEFAAVLQPSVEEGIRREAPNGWMWAILVKPFLPWVLRGAVRELQREVESVLDLDTVVRSGFLRDVRVLVNLFETVAREELKFIVNSGIGFGFLLGWLQMSAWVFAPRMWTLPMMGALVGYVTNWLAIKLVFEPIEPVKVGPFLVQGMFEYRQPEISDEFGLFLATRVLTSPRIIDELVNGRFHENFEAMMRRCVPFVVPDSMVRAAVGGLRQLALEDEQHPAHVYVKNALEMQDTLATRLKALPSAQFEDMVHPVFQEDEITLIVVGGVLGAVMGYVQLVMGWGGPGGSLAIARAGSRFA